MKSSRCPHCQSAVAVGSGYTFDEHLNLRCLACGKVVFATSEESETELARLYTKPTNNSHNPNFGSGVGAGATPTGRGGGRSRHHDMNPNAAGVAFTGHEYDVED